MRSRASRISGDAELVITKTVSPKVAAVGDVLTYTVTVTNRGPDATVQVVNTDASRGKNPILSLKPSQGSCTASRRCGVPSATSPPARPSP
jgi:large repetitive protein